MPSSRSQLACSVLRFGAFELDLRNSELRHGGRKVELQQQPMQVLTVLVRRPGAVVTREELRQHLWPADTFVDFDNSLNTAINKIRKALEDSPENPRFVETLPKRGYRFIGTLAEPANGNGRGCPVTVEALPKPAKSGSRVFGVSVLVALGVLVIVLAYFSHLGRVTRPSITGSTQLTRSAETKIPLLLSDGVRLFFSERVGGQVIPAEVTVGGDDVVPIPTSLKNVYVQDLSPDGSELLVISAAQQLDVEGTLWILSVLGGPPYRMGEIHARSAAWSRDGRSVIYTSGNDIYLAARDGSGVRKLLSTSGFPEHPRWSRDMKLIRFDLVEGEQSSIWQVSAAGTNAHPLLRGWNDPAQECCGTWTPDGKYYVFQSTKDRVSSFWAIREGVGLIENGRSTPIQLTYGPTNMLSPVFNRDGSQLFAMGEQPNGELVRYDAETQQWLPYLGGISAEGVSISPDRQWVAYVTYPEGELWRSKLDMTERLRLTGPSMMAGVPAWSPDGTRIVFSAVAKGAKHAKSYLISREGGTPDALTADDEDEFCTTWSPDGHSLAVSGFPFRSEKGIRIVDAATRQVSTLPGSEGFCCPTWAPDGKHLVAVGVAPQRFMMFTFANRKWSELMRGDFNYMDYSRDGKYFYFDTKTGSDPGVYRLRLSDRGVERVASLKGVRRTPPSVFGAWFDVGPDNSPMVLRNLTGQQLYSLRWQDR